MANEITIRVRAQDDASPTLDKVTNKAEGFGAALGKVGRVAGGVFAGGAALEGVQQLTGFLTSATQAAIEDAASQARLQKAVENTGSAWQDQSEDVAFLISQGQRLAFTDDQIRDSLSLLVAQTGDSEEAYKRLGLAQDLSRGTGLDLVTASRLLGKVTDENVNVLARYGITMKAGATETELFGALQQKFGGQAATFADTTAGKWQQAQIRFGEMKEALGAQLLPAMTALMTVLVSDVIPVLERFIQRVGPDVSKAVTDVAAVVRQYWPEISAVIGFAADFVVAQVEGMLRVIEGITGIVRGVADLVSAIVHGEWAAAWQALKDIVTGALDVLLGSLEAMFGNLPGIFFNAGRDAILGMARGIESAAGSVLKKARDLADKVKDAVTNPLGIFSPSTVMAEVGRNFVRGFEQGIVRETPLAAGAAGAMAGAAAFTVNMFNPVVNAQDARQAELSGGLAGWGIVAAMRSRGVA